MRSWVVFCVLTASAFSFSQGKHYPKAQLPTAVGQMAPDFRLNDQDGKTFRLADQHGHWVLLFFYRG